MERLTASTVPIPVFGMLDHLTRRAAAAQRGNMVEAGAPAALRLTPAVALEHIGAAFPGGTVRGRRALRPSRRAAATRPESHFIMEARP